MALQPLQKVQNCPARLITHTWKYEHITPVLQHLDRLPLHLRSIYKVLLFTYCAIYGLVQDYLAELISYPPLTELYDLLHCQRFCSYRLHWLSHMVIAVSMEQFNTKRNMFKTLLKTHSQMRTFYVHASDIVYINSYQMYGHSFSFTSITELSRK